MSGIISDNLGRASGLIKAAGGGGKVLQVVADTDVTGRTTTSATYVTISGMPSVDITPAATTSKILLLAGFSHSEVNGGEAFITIYRDSTNLATGSAASFARLQATSARYAMGGTAFLDSPSSTSALTYTIQIHNNGSSSYTYNIDGGTCSLVAMEIGA